MANKLRDCMIVWEDIPGSGKWSVLAFDAVVREGYSGAVQITSYPVDSGFQVSDHAIRQNRIITLDTLTSNISMSVATSRKTFEESFNELMVAIGAAQSTGAPVYDAGEVPDPEKSLKDRGPQYSEATKYGRAGYDNDSIDITIPYTSITLGTVTSPFLTAFLAQVSIEKVDEALATVNRLNALGKLVHVITLRGVRKNCVIRQFDAMNDVSNSYSVPISLVLEQLNVVDLARSTVQTSTNYANGDIVAQEQSSVRKVAKEADTFKSSFNPSAPQLLAPVMVAAPFAMKAVSNPTVQTVAVQETTTNKDIVPATFYNLEHREIPFSTSFDTRFIYKGTEYTLGKVTYNSAFDCYVTSLQWRKDGVCKTVESLPLRGGTNLVQQYATNMPSFVAINIDKRNSDPTTPENLRLYIIDGFDETFLGTA